MALTSENQKSSSSAYEMFRVGLCPLSKRFLHRIYSKSSMLITFIQFSVSPPLNTRTTMHTHFCVVLWIFLHAFFYLPLFASHTRVQATHVFCFALRLQYVFLSLLRFKERSKVLLLRSHSCAHDGLSLNQVWNCSHAWIRMWMKTMQRALA